MRILRIRLCNYRGVRERELRFAPSGVTVVHGPNEIGKSSLAEAIDLVLEELDSAAKQRVRQIQPVDRDAGSEIEIEIETGPYRFILSKRFHRAPATQLRVIHPRAESWTGREAHARVQEILDETLDRALWRALRVEQGRGLEQASWQGQPALSTALDRAAGLAGAGAREETLRDAVREEYLRYYTPTGRERRDFDAKARAVARLRQAAHELEETLASLERDVARDAALRAEVPAREAAAAAAEQALRLAEAVAAQSESLREALSAARARRDAAAAEERQASQESRARGQILALRAAAEADASQRADELESSEPELLAARAEADHAGGAHAAAREACEAADAAEMRARAELEWLRAAAELERLHARERGLAAHQAEQALALRALAALPLDAEGAEAIRVAERQLQRTKDRLEAEEPRVRIEAQTALEAWFDGRSVRLAAGERFEQRVSDSLLLSLPGVAEVGVVAGAGAAALRKELEQASTRWRTLCAEAGVDDHASALRALASRGDAERALAAARRAQHDLLAGESADALRARARRQAERVAALRAEAQGGSAPLLAGIDAPAPADADLDAAGTRHAEALRAQARAREAEKAGALRATAAAARLHEQAERARDTEMRLALARQTFADLEARVAAARADCSDEELARRLEVRAARALSLEAEAREAERQLAASDPEQAAARFSATRAAREAAHAALRACRDEQIGIATRLEVRGEQGLFEQREETAAALLRAEREEEGERRRASAAQLLFQTLEAERDACQRAYAGPLRARIEALGREIFGASFEVELDESLRVVRRAESGVALDFEQLSAGAREQIALCARLACATLVAEDGGAPVLLDDALGHSDPQRLAGLGRALGLAGARCQIIVLTCDPARYRHVPSAHWIDLAQ